MAVSYPKFSADDFTGGFVEYKSGGIYLSNTEDVTARRQIDILSNLTNKSLFAIACIALGLSDPVDRAQFKTYFDKIDSVWTDDYIYEYLIEAAYKIKFGEAGP